MKIYKNIQRLCKKNREIRHFVQNQSRPFVWLNLISFPLFPLIVIWEMWRARTPGQKMCDVSYAYLALNGQNSHRDRQDH